MIMIELTENCKQVRLAPAADTLGSACTLDIIRGWERGQSFPFLRHPFSNVHSMDLVDILQG